MIFIIFAFFFWQVAGQTTARGKLEISPSGISELSPYELFLPRSPPTSGFSPVLVFLHGRGESGAFDVTNAQSLPLQLLTNSSFSATFPFITVVPQCPRECMNYNGWVDNVLKDVTIIIHEVVEAHGGDLGRVYLAGQSMGGNGAWMYASQQMNVFAAVVVICGYAYQNDIAVIVERLVRSHTAVGVVHAADDSVIPVEASDTMVNAIKAVHSREGLDSNNMLLYWRYTHAPGPPMPEYAHLIGHGSYEIAFRDSALYSWLLTHECTKCKFAVPKWKPLHRIKYEKYTA